MQEELGLPISPGEPKPWRVIVHRYHVRQEPACFLTRDEAVHFAHTMSDYEYGWVESVLDPNDHDIWPEETA